MSAATTGWDFAEKEAKSAGGGKFVKLESGESIELVFAKQPEVRRVVWTGSATVDFNPEMHKPDEAKPRFVMNCWDPESQAWKVFELSAFAFKHLAAVRHELEDAFPKTRIKVTRDGSGKDTTYRFFPKKLLDAEQLSALSDGASDGDADLPF